MLTEVQIALIGFVATGVLWAMKMWAAGGGQEIPSVVLKWILFVISVVMSIVFALPILPAFPVLVGDPGAIANLVIVWLGAILSMGATVLGFATAIYQVLTKGVLANAVKRRLFASTPAFKK
jgi:hypothetical protein